MKEDTASPSTSPLQILREAQAEAERRAAETREYLTQARERALGVLGSIRESRDYHRAEAERLDEELRTVEMELVTMGYTTPSAPADPSAPATASGSSAPSGESYPDIAEKILASLKAGNERPAQIAHDIANGPPPGTLTEKVTQTLNKLLRDGKIAKVKRGHYALAAIVTVTVGGEPAAAEPPPAAEPPASEPAVPAESPVHDSAAEVPPAPAEDDSEEEESDSSTDEPAAPAAEPPTADDADGLAF